MATHIKIQVPANSTGEQLDTVQGTVTGITGSADRQVFVLGGSGFASSGDDLVGVINTDPTGSEYGLVVRPINRAASAAINIVANNGTSQLTVSGFSSFAIQVTGTWAGTLIFEGNIDPTNASGWVSLDAWDESQEKYVTTTTANGNWWVEPIGSIGAIRVRATAWTSGTATGLILAGMGVPGNFEFTGANGTTLPANIAAVGGSDGTNLRALSVDSTGIVTVHKSPSSVNTFAATAVDSTSLEASHVVKASAGTLYGLSGYNSKNADQFILIFNSTTVPADTTVPIVIIRAAALSNFSWDSGQYGKPFSTGISISNSSTFATKTIGAADCWFNALFA